MAKSIKWDSIEELSGEDVFDSRDVQEWIDELEARKDDEDSPLSEDEAATLKALDELRDCCGREWPHGVGFVRESYWVRYCEEMADDCGYVNAGSGKDHNPLMDCIDWDKWAELVAQDYSTTEVDGVTFYYRD